MNVGRQIAKICDAIDMQCISMHVMRHAFASVLVRRGDVNPEQLRILLGHSDLRTTRRYFHVDKKSLRETVKKRENLSLKARRVANQTDGDPRCG